jgi:hypothetical protein
MLILEERVESYIEGLRSADAAGLRKGDGCG